ncbi:MAG TPA: T9SS type A sorting domain-containing protein, partial [Bacteroidales bacterium]|nr:T9SS type A sorting domain-containing protein [Bacteroidales bacterium]
PSELNNPLYATLLNMTGKTVLQTEVNENTINLENLPTGLYLLVLTDDGKTVYKSKVLVQH